MLCSCAKTEEIPKTSEESQAEITNPFIDTSSETEAPLENYQYGFLYDGEIKNGDVEYTPGDTVNEYNGGNITYRMERDSEGNGGDAEEGYFVFIDGIMQEISCDSEKGEFIILSQPKDTIKEFFLNVVPKITEASKDKEIHVLRMVAVIDPSKQAEDAIFSEIRLSNTFSKTKIKSNVPLEIIDEKDLPVVMPTECEQIPANGNEISRYNIQQHAFADLSLIVNDGNWQSFFLLPEGSDRIKAECAMYGRDEWLGKYRVYFFQNNKPVKIVGGWDCVDMEIKEGYITRCEVEFENLSSRDEIFAIAVPLDDSITSSSPMSDNQLILSETDPHYLEFMKNNG